MKTVKICPKCKKVTLKSAMNVSGWLAPNLFECSNCNYRGAFYIEVDVDDLDEIDEIS